MLTRPPCFGVIVHTLLHQASCYMGSCLPAWQRVDDLLLSLLTDSMCNKYKQKECTCSFWCMSHPAGCTCLQSFCAATAYKARSYYTDWLQHAFAKRTTSLVLVVTAGRKCCLACCPAGGRPSTQAKHAMPYGASGLATVPAMCYSDTGPHGLRTCQTASAILSPNVT